MKWISWRQYMRAAVRLSPAEPSVMMNCFLANYSPAIIEENSRRHHANCRGRCCAGVHAEGSGSEGREAERFQGQEKCGDRFLSARLESRLHERAHLLRE